MAKAFDDNERKLIKDKLKEGALLFIQQQGVRKTSVDELVKYANISKGAFYLFYTSKELLFFDTIIDYHKKLEKEFLNAINKHTDTKVGAAGSSPVSRSLKKCGNVDKYSVSANFVCLQIGRQL